ncbi:ATP-binding protein [Marivirga atlantica]|uniref:TniB family NTP-binding protein n=1 Tax=Marivirga atlantica TaxID=1548457 RepID=A0A937AC86_9BACT|nr:TniB family NTP-binding protein [Marivirga atlantica]MBL0763904.1 TniB family NTP-binding protein [Marivirga atlantica]
MNRHIVEAEYEELLNPDFKGNPLIEAIGVGYSFEIFNQALVKNRPLSRKNALKLSAQERETLLIGLRQRFFVPNENHYALYRSIVNSFLAGYVKRNPFSNNPTQRIKKSYKDLLNFEEELSLTTNSLGSLFIGPSGIGKSTIINKIIGLYPFGIKHDLKGLEPFVQIPFVKLECPKGSSIKELCVDFLEYLDKYLHTNYLKTYFKGNRTGIYELVNAMAKLTISHQIGIIFVDEIQNLINSPRANKDDLLTFFTKLNNTLNIPIIITGTPEITTLIESNYTLMRRWSGEGATKWNRLAKGEDWELFIYSLFKYQYTDELMPYDESASNYFYAVSQGLIDIAIRLFVGAQREAFETNKSCISYSILNKVKRSKFWLEDTAIEEIRNPRKYGANKFTDLIDTQYGGVSNISLDDRCINIQNELLKINPDLTHLGDTIKSFLEINPEKSDSEITVLILKSFNETESKPDSRDILENSKLDAKGKPVFTEGDLRLCYDSDELKLKHNLDQIGVLFDLKNSNLLMK